MTALLEVDNLTGGYLGTNVLFNIFARIEAGTILGVVGRNGVGQNDSLSIGAGWPTSFLG